MYVTVKQTITTDVDVDLNEISTDDLLEELSGRGGIVANLMENLDHDELTDLYAALRREFGDQDLPTETLHDQMKTELILEVWNDYTPEQLQQLLKK